MDYIGTNRVRLIDTMLQQNRRGDEGQEYDLYTLFSINQIINNGSSLILIQYIFTPFHFSFLTISTKANLYAHHL